MNCANHPDRGRAAFCQSCGKPLCTECIRNVGSSTYCEPCLVARVSGVPPAGFGRGPAGYAPGPASYATMPPPVAAGDPNPGTAALLGFIPGVGAMYNGQYAKGIVHLVVFALLVSLTSDVNGMFGLFIAGWVAYMVIEAHHTARARRDGTPLPNPFGLNDLSERLGFGKAWPGAAPPVDPNSGAAPFGAAPYVPPGAYAPPYNNPYNPPASSWGAPNDPAAYGVPPVPPAPPYPDPNLPFSRRFPSGAIWLIGLGLFFLLGDTQVFHFLHGRFLGPIFMIGLGVWVFVHKMTRSGHGIENDGTPLYHWRLMQAITGGFWLALTGVIWLLDEAHILSWAHSWPLYVIGAGISMFLRRTTYSGYGYGPHVPPAPPAVPPVGGTTAVPTTQPGAAPSSTGSYDQEGR